MRRFLFVLAGLGALGIAAACAGDGDDPGVTPIAPPDDSGSTVDATIIGDSAAPPEVDADPPPGDTCGDRAGLQANAAWPIGGGCPTRSGVTALPGTKSSSARIAVEYGGGESGPVITASQVMYVGSKSGVVYALEPGSLAPRARKIGDGEITSTAAIAVNGDAIIGAPDGTLYALNTTSGTELDGGAAVDAGGGSVPGANLLNIAWSLNLGAPIKSSPVIGPDGTIYVGTTDGKLVAARSTPAIVWKADTGDTFGSSPALARDGTIYIGSTDKKLHAFRPDGAPTWATDLGAEIEASPAVGGDGTVYIGTTAGKVHALTPQGVIKWTYEAAAPLVGTPAVYGGSVYFACEDKRLYALNVADGGIRWSYLTLGVPHPPIVTENGNLYFGSGDGRIYVLTPKGGLFFAAVAKGIVTSAPALSPTGAIFVSTDRGLSILGP